MAARFAGSRSVDERRRRRLAAEEKQPSTQDSGDPANERELPTRRPTGRFPLRRLIPSSRWKLTATILAVFAGAEFAVLAGQLLPSMLSGGWGPGLRDLLDGNQGRLATSCAGVLLLVSGQLAWLIRWARARSLRDFGGGYRVWLWASAALLIAGICVLSDAHQAFASTVAWATSRQLFGSDAAYEVLPALAALVLLIPSLQSDMRGCITSRTLMLGAATLLSFGIVCHVAAGFLEGAATAWGLTLPIAVITRTVLMSGTAGLFASLLFHARHVVYECVEPPERKPRAKSLSQSATDKIAVEEEKKLSIRKTRRGSRSTKQAATAEEVTTTSVSIAEELPAKESPAVRPEVVARAAAKPDPPAPKPAPPVKPAAVAPPAANDDYNDEADDGDSGGHASFNGRQIRLDGAEDVRGLSKRERRKLRKAMKGREEVET